MTKRYKTRHEKRKELLQLVLNSKAVERFVSIPEVSMLLLIIMLEILKQAKYQIEPFLREFMK